MFRALANKTLGIRLSALQRLFIIESEANLLQLFIHQLKTSALRSEARMLFFLSLWELRKKIMQPFNVLSITWDRFFGTQQEMRLNYFKKFLFYSRTLGFPMSPCFLFPRPTR